MDPVRLYYLRPSHYCEKARAILAYKGIPHELVNVPYNDHTGVIDVSDQDYTPYIDVPGGKGVLWPDVAEWAEQTRPEPTLYPGDAGESRARSRLIEHWAHNVLEEHAWRAVVPDTPAKFSDQAERWVFVEFQERKRGPLEALKDQQPANMAELGRTCGLVQDVLGQKPYILGDAPSLADMAVFGALHPLKFVGQPIPAGLDGLTAWHGRMLELVGAP